MRVPARIARIRQETPTVRSFALDLGGQHFSFLPGQWIDCYADIDGRTEVAGFSMTSSPSVKGTIELAVKLVGSNPVTHFLHRRAKVGDLLHVDGGQGEFYYQREMGDWLVLIAGGIGITPLMSVMRYADEAANSACVTLLYSATTPSELLFHNQLVEMEARNARLRCLLTVTRPRDEPWAGRVGRIDAAMLAQAQARTDALFYVCGPPGMIEDMVALLDGLGVAPSRVKYESW